jgi:hypothetical protein
VVLLLVWSLVEFRGGPAARVAVLVGVLAMLAAGVIGRDMIAVVAATGDVPPGVVFGAAGSAKLAHGIGMHGLQLLGLLAIGLELRPSRARTRLLIMLLAAAGYGCVFASVTVTAYAGRAWTAPTLPMALLALAGLLAGLVAGTAAVRLLRSGARDGSAPDSWRRPVDMVS